MPTGFQEFYAHGAITALGPLCRDDSLNLTPAERECLFAAREICLRIAEGERDAT